jgi:putative glutamine amidotransferase
MTKKKRPVVGVIANHYMMNDRYAVHASGVINTCAVAEVAQCLPLIIPTNPSVNVDDLLEACDGFLFTGGQPNVHPSEYGHDETPAHGAFDRERDGVTLALLRACVARGQPFLGICRGFQELNVAMGGTLHPEIRELAGRMNHRMPRDVEIEEQFAYRHNVALVPGGVFHRLFGAQVVRTNSLHGQGIFEAGARIVIDGVAEDGTPEAIYVKDAPGFTLAVQWHPEWNAANDSVSRPLFQAFGDAVRAWDDRS